MSRPREFEESEVLDQALDLFWTRGYEATSVQDLVDATGVGRASLYATFGDKEQLFARVIDHYLAKASGGASALSDVASPRAALEHLMGAWLGTTCPKQGPRGCFLILSGTAGYENPAARDALAASLERMEKLIEATIARGQKLGEFKNRADPKVLARFLIVMMQGIATSSRAGWGREKLRQVLDETMSHLDIA